MSDDGHEAATDAERLAAAAGLVSHSTESLVDQIAGLREDFRAAREQAEADLEAAKQQAAKDVATERRDRRRAGWKFALGNTTESHRITLAGQTLDSTHSGVATFDLDVSARKANSLVLLVAIIRVGTTAADDIALTSQTLRELALTSSNVAVRSMSISA